MRWFEYAIGLPVEDQRRLALRITTALDEIRAAAEILTEDGDLEELRRQLAMAGAWIADAERLLSEASSYQGPRGVA